MGRLLEVRFFDVLWSVFGDFGGFWGVFWREREGTDANLIGFNWICIGESTPIRLFLGGFDLTPTFRDVNKKFSTRWVCLAFLFPLSLFPLPLASPLFTFQQTLQMLITTL